MGQLNVPSYTGAVTSQRYSAPQDGNSLGQPFPLTHNFIFDLISYSRVDDLKLGFSG